jgi:hypothetical protein
MHSRDKSQMSTAAAIKIQESKLRHKLLEQKQQQQQQQQQRVPLWKNTPVITAGILFSLLCLTSFISSSSSRGGGGGGSGGASFHCSDPSLSLASAFLALGLPREHLPSARLHSLQAAPDGSAAYVISETAGESLPLPPLPSQTQRATSLLPSRVFPTNVLLFPAAAASTAAASAAAASTAAASAAAASTAAASSAPSNLWEVTFLLYAASALPGSVTSEPRIYILRDAMCVMPPSHAALSRAALLEVRAARICLLPSRPCDS